MMREPVMTSEAEIQTIYITTGYAWSQSSEYIIIYLSFQDANEINDYTFDVSPRGIELNILHLHRVNYRFKLNHLYGSINTEKSSITFKQHKIIIKLNKQDKKKWHDLNMKSIQNKYHELERYVKQIGKSTQQYQFETPFQQEDHVHQ